MKCGADRRERGVAIATSQTRPSLPSMTTIIANMDLTVIVHNWVASEALFGTAGRVGSQWQRIMT
jgi:hypothetical protein